MPTNHSHPKPHRRSSARAPLSIETHTQSQQHSRPSLSSTPGAKINTLHISGPQNSHSSRQNVPQVQSSRSRREIPERTTRGPSASKQHGSRPTQSGPGAQPRAPPVLKTKDVLGNPRLQQVTGLLPGKVDLWGDVELPPDELYRLAWAMALPEPFPSKRPRGEIRTPVALKVKRYGY
ncbi:hypothetical protein F4802DRAFT_94130 [Xylaria palmicola]|nr:hypothetical protein F4802DRAFT_94130 [Xylaria palmicola]